MHLAAEADEGMDTDIVTSYVLRDIGDDGA